MALAFPVLAGLVLAPLLGGSLRRLGKLELRSAWLFFAAIALQLVAFPLDFLPWRTGDATARGLWLTSYCLLLLAAVRNRHVRGVVIVAVGMLSNLLAILANRGHMPVVPEAMRQAGENYVQSNNSVALGDSNLPWLVDRWAAPDWVPLANVFSIGDVLIAAGALVIVLAATGARVPFLLLRRLGITGAAQGSTR